MRRSRPSFDRLQPGRTVLAVALGAFLTAVVLWLSAQDLQDRDEVKDAVPLGVVDPQATELARCSAMGSAALDDAACRAVWAENRRRFLGPGASAIGEGPR